MRQFDKNKYVKSFDLEDQKYFYYSITEAAQDLGFDIDHLPYSLKIVFENLLRNYDNNTVKIADLQAFKTWIENGSHDHEIALRPVRVLMQDFTGVPAVVDLATMRDAIKDLGGNPQTINPLSAVDLVIDHSVQVDKYGSKDAFKFNVDLEMQRNIERYQFLKWGQDAFNNFRVVPPGTGICHQVNLEYLSKVVWTEDTEGKKFAMPDSLVGTDSHTTMVNGLAVLGWGVGGIEAEAVMLGQAMSMTLPDVVGFELAGKLSEGVTATDLVLTVTEMLRKLGVVNKFVEYYGPGLESLALADRATIANMAPEYGATCGFFPVDEETIKYLRLTSRSEELIELVQHYSQLQHLLRNPNYKNVKYSAVIRLDLANVEPCLAGPKRPQDKVLLPMVSSSFQKLLSASDAQIKSLEKFADVEQNDYQLGHGDLVIAAITSCTNTSNPSVLIAAGLVAKKAIELGLEVKPWVKTSLAPGSQVVTEYLEHSGLQKYLDQAGFNLVGYGCTTCIGNSGPLKPEIEDTISTNNLIVSAILSGNRNFEGRVHPLVKANYLASPPLVVAYAFAGSVNIDITKDAIGTSQNGKEIFLTDIWPSADEINTTLERCVTAKLFAKKYANVFQGDQAWQALSSSKSDNYTWNSNSTYIRKPNYFDGMTPDPHHISDIKNANILGIFGDSITTDHISPAGNISRNSPAAQYLISHGVHAEDFNSYGARRGNHEVMMRGTFANIRIKNEMVPGTEGGFTKYKGLGDVISIYDAAMKYKLQGTSLVIFAGKEYGTGSSRDWAAKGTMLLGVKAVIAESFERIHRSNLVRMGVIPLEFTQNQTRKDLYLSGAEQITITGFEQGNLVPNMLVDLHVSYQDSTVQVFKVRTRIDTMEEITYMQHGGILQYVVRQLLG
jgi:aconitate hydratase